MGAWNERGVRVVPLRDPAKVMRVLSSLRRLVDAWRDGLKPSEFWAEGTYHPSPRFVNAYLVILWPGKGPVDRAALARRAARLLEARHGLALDWAAGFRGGGAVWLVVKARAYRAGNYKLARFRPDKGDLAALRGLVGAGRTRERTLERGR